MEMIIAELFRKSILMEIIGVGKREVLMADDVAETLKQISDQHTAQLNEISESLKRK